MRERERVCVCVREKEGGVRERKSVCVWCIRENESVWCVRERKSVREKRVCVEREREECW